MESPSLQKPLAWTKRVLVVASGMPLDSNESRPSEPDMRSGRKPGFTPSGDNDVRFTTLVMESPEYAGGTFAKKRSKANAEDVPAS